MAYKTGLNRKEQLLNAKWLEEGVPATAIAKKLKVDVSVVKKFTREKLNAAAKAAEERKMAAEKAAKERAAKAMALTDALKVTQQGGEFS